MAGARAAIGSSVRGILESLPVHPAVPKAPAPKAPGDRETGAFMLWAGASTLRTDTCIGGDSLRGRLAEGLGLDGQYTVACAVRSVRPLSES
jgi:hypothetical protein